MKKLFLSILATSWLLLPADSRAATISAPNLTTPAGLSIAEVQITGDEYIILQNNTGSIISDLSTYWLYYFNKTDPSTTKPAFIQLPAGKLDQGQTVQLSTVGRPACGASIVDNLSSSLADAGGFLEVVKFSVNANGTINETAGDSVSWSSGTTGNIQKVASATPQPIWYRYQASSIPTYSWQKAQADSTSACQLSVPVSGAPTQPVNSGSLKPASGSPPATIIFLASDGNSLPVADDGLTAPQLTEILPNPKTPQTDDNDEFIELYNPNDKSFDLTGFKLRAGTTTPHDFSFGPGTLLKPKAFTFFLSADTHLSLTNTNGQVKLLDPAGQTVSQTDVYGSAKEGQTWALANGQWFWTNSPTPGAANAIDQASGGSTGPTPTGQLSGSTSPTSTNSGSRTSGGTYTSQGSQSISGGQSKSASSPLHPAILAVVGAMAVSYALYEYRHDLANTLERFRRYRQHRRAAGAGAQTADGDRTVSRLRGWQNNLRQRFSQRPGNRADSDQPQFHPKSGVPGQVWYETLPLRLLPIERLRRARRSAGRGHK